MFGSQTITHPSAFFPTAWEREICPQLPTARPTVPRGGRSVPSLPWRWSAGPRRFPGLKLRKAECCTPFSDPEAGDLLDPGQGSLGVREGAQSAPDCPWSEAGGALPCGLLTLGPGSAQALGEMTLGLASIGCGGTWCQGSPGRGQVAQDAITQGSVAPSRLS